MGDSDPACSHWLRESCLLDAARISGGTLNINRIPDLPSTKITGLPAVRTALFTPSDTVGVWTGSAAAFSIAVSDIDNYEYITVSLFAGVNSADRASRTVIVLMSEIPVSSTPGVSDGAIGIYIDAQTGGQDGVFMGRDSDGTALVFNPTGGQYDYGKIMGIWGGDF